MAITSRDFWTVSATFVDDDGATSRMSINAHEPSTALGYPIIEAWAVRFIPLVAAVIDATLLEFSVSKNFFEDDPLERVPTAGSDVEDKGVFLLETENMHKGSFSVPSILEDKLVSSGALSGIQIDLDDADVAALVVYLTEDVDMNPFGLAGDVHAVDSRGEEYVRTYDAYKQNRASFKSRGRKG